MPFQSEKQRRYLWANEPEIARDWADTYGSRIEKNDGGITRIPLRRGGPQDWGAEAEAKQKGSANVSKDNPYSDAAQRENRELNRRVEASTTLRRLAEDKKEERVEKFRHKNINNPLTKAMNYVPYIGTLKKMFPKGHRDFFLEEVLGKGHYGELTEEEFYGLSPVEQEEKLKNYNRARGMGEIDAYGRKINQGGDGSYYPRDVHPGTGVIEVDEVDEVVEDVPSTYEGGVTMAQLPHPKYHERRIPAAYGGIMDSSTGRRAYGLGSIFKSIKKAASKVLKSDVGKGILGAAAMYGLNRWGVPGTNKLGQGWFSNMGKWGKGIALASSLPFFMGGKEEDEDEVFDYDAAKQLYADKIMNIKRGVRAGTLDPNEYSYLPSDYTYTGAEGGRAGYYAGGQSTPSDYTMEDAMMTTTQDKLGGITDVMKQADLNRQGSVGQFYAAHGGSADDKLMARIKELQDEGLDYNSARAQAEKESQGKAQGGRIGYAHGGAGYPPVTMGQVPQAPPQAPAPPQRPHPMPAPQPNRMAGMNPMMGGNPIMNRPMMNPRGGAMPRVMAQEGGLMDLGGMEKDYRQEGGFVPLGGEEKADDVPARLSKNEFVFTADAVRAAGGGDVDAGAEIMENVMKNLEQGGQVSEETQGLSGAQEMFGVSERLSEVV